MEPISNVNPLVQPARKSSAKPVKKTRTPRTVSPEVEAIRAEARAKISALHNSMGSGKILQTIITKRLPAMTPAHRQELFDVLAHEFTPALLKK
jgi:anthranilate/para-aminobenzoate synthase component I